MIEFEIFFATVAKQGRNNQDNLMIDKYVTSASELMFFSGKLLTDNSEKRVFVVSDGAGGGSEGEKASLITVEEFCKALDFIKCSNFEIAVSKALDEANNKVTEYFKETGEIGAATVSGIVFEKENALVFNVGDSPVFRLRDGVLEKLSKEHTVAAEENSDTDEGKNGIDANTITRYMGNAFESGSGQADVCDFSFRQGDVYLIASDGVEKGLNNSKIKKLLLKKDENIAEEIVCRAYKNGSDDDTTAIVIKVSK